MPEFAPIFYPVLLVVGVASGFLNVMAGGGTLLTLPLMIFMGMPAAAANGTNRIALVLQNAVAAASFKKGGFSDLKVSMGLGLATLPGAVLGAVFAVKIDEAWFRKFLAVVMIAVLITTLWPSRKSDAPDAPGPAQGTGRWRLVAAHLAMVGIGFYGGFVQAGIGFVMMPVLQHLLRLDLVRVNMHKVAIVLVYSIPVLAIFAYYGQVVWFAGVVMAVGSAVGAAVATRVQIKRGEGPIRIIFAIAVVAMAIKLFF